MIYPIVIYGAPQLRAECTQLAPGQLDTKQLIADMFLTLESAEGVGLAAPQIGKNIRLFIIDCTPWGDEHPELAECRRAFINPEIYWLSPETKLYNEGCRRTDLIRWNMWLSGYNWSWKNGVPQGADYGPEMRWFPIPSQMINQGGYKQNPGY